MNIARQILRALLFILPLYGFVLVIYYIPHCQVMNSIKVKIKEQHNVILYFLSFLTRRLTFDSLLKVRYNNNRKI